VEQVAQEGQVQPGELEGQGGGYGGGQARLARVPGRTLESAATASWVVLRAREGHALPGAAGGLVPDGHAEGHGGDDHADPGDPLPEPGPENASAGGRGGRRMMPGVGRLAAQRHPGRAVGEQVDPQDLSRLQRQGQAEEGPGEHDRDLGGPAG